MVYQEGNLERLPNGLERHLSQVLIFVRNTDVSYVHVLCPYEKCDTFKLCYVMRMYVSFTAYGRATHITRVGYVT